MPYHTSFKGYTNSYLNLEYGDYISIVSSSSESESIISDDLSDDYVMLRRRILKRYDKKIDDISTRAREAFKDGDKELFTKIVLETKSLYIRDEAVRVAAEVDWIDVARKLLVREPIASYQYHTHVILLSWEFTCDDYIEEAENPQGRWLLQVAMFSAVGKGKDDIFNLLAPIIGVDFTDPSHQNVIAIIFNSELDLDTKKKWFNSIIEYINRNSSRPLLESAILYFGQLQLIEHLPHLLDCLFSTGKQSSSRVMVALNIAIGKGHQEVVHCMLDEFEKASIQIRCKIIMYSAESSGDIDLILRLHQNGCHSFPLRQYGEKRAEDLRKLLSKNGHEYLYPSIVVD